MLFDNNLITDLAIETQPRNLHTNAENSDITKTKFGTVTHISVKSSEEEELFSKPMGEYCTYEYNSDDDIGFSESLSLVLSPFISSARTVLVAGLGNRAIPPDALGSLTVDRVFATRILSNSFPEINGKSVSCLAPGVLASTGMETAEIFAAICDKIRPDAVIAVDSLCARDVHRICRTYQITDSGISPGGGLSNNRKALTSSLLNTKIVSIGVPTVVYCRTVCHNVMEEILRKNGETDAENSIKAVMESLDDEFIKALVVTPKDINEQINRSAKIIASAINYACGNSELEELYS